VKKTLGNELQSMNEEIDNQTKQQVKLQEDIHEMEEAIQQLSENLDDLSEQMLRIDLKLSQGNNERIRLEQEY
jgi:predicted  nucleic acid-binding Zn-ribbon protein